jgi:hypothetical protein
MHFDSSFGNREERLGEITLLHATRSLDKDRGIHLSVLCAGCRIKF